MTSSPPSVLRETHSDEVSKIVIRRNERLHLVDSARGIAILMMVIYHLLYNLKFIFKFEIPLFEPPFATIWQLLIASMFLSIAGFSSHLSHSNIARGLRLAAVAIVISTVTWVAQVDTPIYFGVIHCLSLCVLLFVALKPLLEKIDARFLAIVFLYLYYVTYTTKSGYLTLAPGIMLALPDALYQNPYLFWLGFPSERFVSGDYFPLLPYIFIFLFGAAIGMIGSTRGYSEIWYRGKSRLLGFLGNHSLAIYLLHQPILLLILYIILQ